MVGAGLYAVLRAVGIELRRRTSARWSICSRCCWSAVPTAWLVARFATALYRAYPDRPWVRRLTVVALASATLLTSFSVTLNNHTVAAVLLFAAWMAALERRPLLAGSCAALAAAVDLVTGAVFLPVIAYLVWDAVGTAAAWRARRRRSRPSALSPSDSNLWILGLAAAAAVRAGRGRSERRQERERAAGQHTDGPRLGASGGGARRGLFGEPWLPLGVARSCWSASPAWSLAARGGRRADGAATALPQRGMTRDAGTQRGIALAAGACVALAGRSCAPGLSSLGGWSYGYRYLIPLIPLLLFFVPARSPSGGAGRSAALVAVSIPLALLGAYHPWPPVWEPESRAGARRDHEPGGRQPGRLAVRARARLGTHRASASTASSSADERVRNRYLYFFQRSKGATTGARAAYLDSLRRDPRQPMTHYDYAEALAALGDLEQAARHYGRALELAPGFEEARRGLVQTLARARTGARPAFAGATTGDRRARTDRIENRRAARGRLALFRRLRRAANAAPSGRPRARPPARRDLRRGVPVPVPAGGGRHRAHDPARRRRRDGPAGGVHGGA